MQFLDIIIIAIFLFYAFEGFAVGFFLALFDLVSFIAAFTVGLKAYSSLGRFLVTHTALPPGFANAIAFFLIAFLAEIFFSIILRKVFRFTKQRISERFPKQHQSLFIDDAEARENTQHLKSAYLRTISRILGILPGIASAFILLAFLFTVVISLPFSPFLKRAISNSRIANFLVTSTQGWESNVNGVFGEAIHETISFFTVAPQSETSINLRFTTTRVSIDEQAEKEMLLSVNSERAKKGLAPLRFNKELTDLARVHAKDMFARGYFSHYTPERLSPFDRMALANIAFITAGENLALAPNVDLAMQGLMHSPGHRANILSPKYGKVGIGVIDGGIYGEMFTQEFTE